MGGIAVAFGVLLSFASVPGDLDLRDVHPDETAEETYDKRFSFSNAIASLERVRTALKDPDAMSAEERTIGCQNWVGVLEGTLRKQQLIINRLTYELAVEHHAQGEITTESLERAAYDFQEQKRLFLEFWEKFGVAD